MSRSPELQAFLNRYFMVFMGAYFLSIFAAGGTFSLLWSTYCRHCSHDFYYPLSLLLTTVVFTTAHAAVARGRSWGAGCIAGLCIGCIVIVLPTYSYRPHLFVYTSIPVAALLALLVLNSTRYRQMREELGRYRQQRMEQRLVRKGRVKVRRGR